VAVRSDLKRRGLGRLLVRRLIAYARRRSVGTLWGHVLRENESALALFRAFGFVSRDAGDPGVILTELVLSPGIEPGSNRAPSQN
jgi:GNAT superfamily N-acetyltransferase